MWLGAADSLPFDAHSLQVLHYVADTWSTAISRIEGRLELTSAPACKACSDLAASLGKVVASGSEDIFLSPGYPG